MQVSGLMITSLCVSSCQVTLETTISSDLAGFREPAGKVILHDNGKQPRAFSLLLGAHWS